MITAWLFKAVSAMLTGVMGLFPAWTFPIDLSNAGQNLGQWLGFGNQYVPVTYIGIALAALLGTKAFIFAVRLVLFIYRLIPLKFT